MFDRALALAIVEQIDKALETIKSRTAKVESADDLTGTQSGLEKLDGLCMLFIAIGEALKNLDQIRPLSRVAGDGIYCAVWRFFGG